MTKRSALFFIFLLLATAIPAISQAQFYEACEDYPNLNGEWRLTESSGKLSVSSEQKRAGNNSYKFEFKAGTTGYAEGTKRVELRLSKSPFGYLEYNKEYWIGYSMFVPSNFAMPSAWAITGQIHKMADKNDCDQAPRPANPAVREPFAIHILGTDTNPILRTEITGQSQRCQPNGYTYRNSFDSPALRRGGWNDIVIHIIFRYDSKGTTEMWLNGHQFINIREINAHNDELPHYFKLGF